MVLKAVLFDFNGVIINDEPLHKRLLEQLLVEENTSLRLGEYQAVCLGKSDRACLRQLLEIRGRAVTDDIVNDLVLRKSQIYLQTLESIPQLPIYEELVALLEKLCSVNLTLAVVSGAERAEIEYVLQRAALRDYFSVIVGGDEVQHSKPNPEGYLTAVEQLNQQYPELALKPADCLVIEDTLAGIEAARQGGMIVVGVAHTYPYHMLQRCTNWTIDYLSDLELERVMQVAEAQCA